MTESHLNQNILDAEIDISGFTVYRSDRRYRTHGGAVTWVRSDLAVKKEHRFSNGVCDTLVLFIPSLSLALINFYRPPDTTYDEFFEALKDIKKFLETIETDDVSPTICLTGDLNMPFLTDWTPAGLESFLSKVEVREKTADNKKQAVILIKFLNDNFMVQHVTENTRKGNLLDLFCTNDPSLVLGCWNTVNTVLSDHNTVFISLSYGLQDMEGKTRINHTETCIPDYDLSNGDREDWLRFNMLLQQINWEELFEDKSVNEMTGILLQKCEENVKKIFKQKLNDETSFTAYPQTDPNPAEQIRPPKTGRPPESGRPPDTAPPCKECEEEKVHECAVAEGPAPLLVFPTTQKIGVLLRIWDSSNSGAKTKYQNQSGSFSEKSSKPQMQ